MRGPRIHLPRSRRGRVTMGASTVLVAVGVLVAALLIWGDDQEGVDRCEIKSNDEYAAVVDEALAGYDAAASDPANDAVMNVGNVAEYSFAPLFQMRACSFGEDDLQDLHEGVQHVLYDPEFHSAAWRAAPIDIEVAWFDNLGVDGLLTGWGDLARSREDDDTAADLQRLLSTGLARATNPDREHVLASGVYPEFLIDAETYLSVPYTAAFIEIGSGEVQLAEYSDLLWGGESRGKYLVSDPEDWELERSGPNVHGWSTLAPLLRFGDFHEDFLTPVATAIVEFDQAHKGDWVIEGEEAVSFDMFDEEPTNAMDAVLAALSRNPDAAAAVYDATGDDRVGALLEQG